MNRDTDFTVIREELLAYVRARIPSDGRDRVDAESRLFETGVFDSFDFIALVVFAEQRYGVVIVLGDTSQQFESITELTRLIVSSSGVA